MRQGKLLDGWKPEPKAGKKKSSPSKKTDRQSKSRRKSEAPGSDEEDQAEASPNPSSSPERKRKRAAYDGKSADEAPSKEGDTDNGSKSAEENGSKPEAPVDGEEEYSDVIDEPPIPKRKKTKKDTAAKPAKSTKPSKAAAATATKKSNEPDDPLEAEIKKLQSQLTKCGVRKLWHNELKSCGDDARAKIRHLKKMLSDIGMDGRFSEAKAREIKETRELLADAEAAQEMNRLWGMESGGRSSRNKGRAAAKVVESEGSEAEDDGDEAKKEEENDDEDEDVSFAARRRRAQADLAFLGDESDSD